MKKHKISLNLPSSTEVVFEVFLLSFNAAATAFIGKDILLNVFRMLLATFLMERELVSLPVSVTYECEILTLDADQFDCSADFTAATSMLLDLRGVSLMLLIDNLGRVGLTLEY